MNKSQGFPNDKSKVKYLGGYDHPNCDLIVGKVYEILGQYKDDKGVEIAYIRMDEELDHTWYIKGKGSQDNDFDKFEVVEQYFTREELIALNEEKDVIINKLSQQLKSAVDMDNFVSKSELISHLEDRIQTIKDFQENAGELSRSMSKSMPITFQGGNGRKDELNYIIDLLKNED